MNGNSPDQMLTLGSGANNNVIVKKKVKNGQRHFILVSYNLLSRYDIHDLLCT